MACNNLTPKEIRRLQLYSSGNGLSITEVAQFENLSKRTIEKDFENIKRKLQSKNLANAVFKFLSQTH